MISGKGGRWVQQLGYALDDAKPINSTNLSTELSAGEGEVHNGA